MARAAAVNDPHRATATTWLSLGSSMRHSYGACGCRTMNLTARREGVKPAPRSGYRRRRPPKHMKNSPWDLPREASPAAFSGHIEEAMTEYEPAAHMPPPPATLSEAAVTQMAGMITAGPIPEMTMDQMRFFAEQMQIGIGGEQKKAYPVTVTDDTIAGVRVRRIARESGVTDRAK